MSRNKLSDGVPAQEIAASRRNENGVPYIPVMRRHDRDYRSTARKYFNGCGRRDHHHAAYSFGETGTKLPFGM
jgi:hypothetical protein